MTSRTSRALAAFLLVVAAVAVAIYLWARPSPAPQHMILFVGDGMQLEHEVAASRYLYGRDQALAWHAFPYRSYVATWDVTTYNNFAEVRDEAPFRDAGFRPEIGFDPAEGGGQPSPLVRSEVADAYFVPPDRKVFATDSASSATALATGYKTDDGNIAWLPGDPENGKLKTIAERLRDERGFAIGVVTTVPFTHATPASFVSHNVHRNNYHQIAEEIVSSVRPDVVIGGGHPDHRPTYMSQASLEALRRDPSWVLVERKAGSEGGQRLLEAARKASAEGKRLFGLFGGPEGNFESPVPVDAPGAPAVNRATVENPLLEQATIAALEVLSRDPDGFFALIEQGDIDWANHDHDYARMIGTVWDLDRAVRAAAAFVDREGDDVTWQNTLVIVTADHANSYMRLDPGKRLGAGDLPAQEGAGKGVKYPGGEVSYGWRGHTNELVTLAARGAGAGFFAQYEGSWYPCTRILDNTQVFSVLAEAGRLAARSPLRPTVTRPSSCPEN
ncbi:MAG: alkaline phosphatase [Vicinamibacterales bacterium]